VRISTGHLGDRLRPNLYRTSRGPVEAQSLPDISAFSTGHLGVSLPDIWMSTPPGVSSRETPQVRVRARAKALRSAQKRKATSAAGKETTH
jgi:hypothetical protein